MKKSVASPILETTQFSYAAYVGIDWADQKHDICLYDPIIQQSAFFTIGSQPEAIDAWVEGLRKRFAGGTVAICTEQKRGPLIYALCKYEFLVLYPINAQTVAKYRQAFAPSRAKADRTDAQILVELAAQALRQTQGLETRQCQTAVAPAVSGESTDVGGTRRCV